MIRVQAIQNFTLANFNEIKIIKRKGVNLIGSLFEGDIFECTEEMCKYLMGNNRKGMTVIKVLEVIPKATTAAKKKTARRS